MSGGEPRGRCEMRSEMCILKVWSASVHSSLLVSLSTDQYIVAKGLRLKRISNNTFKAFKPHCSNRPSLSLEQVHVERQAL